MSQTHNLIECVLREHLESCSLLSALEAALGATQRAGAESASVLLLPVWVCRAAGGDPQQAVSLAAAWRLLYAAASLLDDVEDDELDNELWPAMSPAQATNVATALVFLSQLVLGHLDQSGVDAGLALAIQRAFNHASLRVCAGQHVDLAADSFTLGQYWQMAAAKSGYPFSVACSAGAMLGTEDARQIDRYAVFGHNLGVLTQISDDFSGVWRSIEQNDLAVGSKTLPLVYAMSVGTAAERKRLQDLLCVLPTERTVLGEAQRMIADSGALQYALVQAEIYRKRAKDALPAADGDRAAHSQLVALVDRILPALSVTDGVAPPRD